jgi:ornithine cyclodeaminase/alanine dehydrogenase-like protein (mu-crystallin family)
MIWITEEQVLANLPMGEAVGLVRQGLAALGRGEAQNLPRRRLFLPGGAVLHQMAGAWGAYFGTKVYSTHPRHGAHFHFLLYDAATGLPLALFDANHLGQIRTGATTGVAVDLLAPPGAATLGLIGSGFQAWTQLEAVAAVRRLGEVRVWSRSAERCAAFAGRAAQALGLNAVAVSSAEAAARGADIVVTATSAKDPVIEAAWVAADALVCAVGSNNPARRELPAALLERAVLVAADSLEQCAIEAGDLLLARPREDWSGWPLRELPVLLAGTFTPPAGVKIFKSTGLAVEDVVVAAAVYEKLRPAGGATTTPAGHTPPDHP